MSKTVYRDFNHWWREGNHGYSSASREYAQELWDDLEPTILASRDDYKNAYVELMKETADRRSDVFSAALEFIDLFMKEGSPKFFRWYVDGKRKEDEPAE